MVKLAELAGHADRGGDLLPRRRHALRPLLGRRRGVPQPAFRDVLLPGNRVLHRTGPAAFRTRNAGRAQSAARLRADAHVVGALDRGSAIPARNRQLPAAGASGSGPIHRAGARARSIQEASQARSLTHSHARLDRLAVRTRFARRLSSGGPRAARTRRPARRRRRSFSAAPARRLSTRHLSLVLARSTDPVVVSRIRARCCSLRSSSVSRSLAKSIRNRGYVTQLDTAFRDVIRACGSTELRPGGTWLSPEMRAAYLRCTGWDTRIRSKPGRASVWSAACTASRSAACSSASPCSASNAMRPKSRSSACARTLHAAFT